jgi:hypothetical protein
MMSLFALCIWRARKKGGKIYKLFGLYIWRANLLPRSSNPGNEDFLPASDSDDEPSEGREIGNAGFTLFRFGLIFII